MTRNSSETIKIGLLGASFDTGNRGVSALAESSIQCILNQWPNAAVDLLASGRTASQYRLHIENREIEVGNIPIRFCKNIFMHNHYAVLFATAVLLKLLPFQSVRQGIAKHNAWYARIAEMDLVADITGGDSFSDIYGTRRFIQGALLKYLFMLFGTPFLFLPQTYGPFSRRWVQWAARFLLKRADRIYSRDRRGYDTIQRLFRHRPSLLDKVHIVPDVAFILKPLQVDDALTKSLRQYRAAGKTIIGLNVNGLLYSGGYTRNNMFKLSVDYPRLIENIVLGFLEMPETAVLLVPHVCPSQAYQVESDPAACERVIQRIGSAGKDRILLPNADYDHRQIKYIIGFSDFFLGSRMHSCIAAMSQCIPTVGLAYSDKFSGVFDSIGQGKNIVDLRTADEKKILDESLAIYARKDLLKEELMRVIPKTREQVLEVFRPHAGP